MSLDIQGLLVEEVIGNESTRRGPLRPERLVSVRKRQDRRLAGHRFRAVDTVFLLAVTIAFLQRTLERSVLETPMAEVIPIGLGVWSTWLLMRALGLYRLGRTERMIWHFARVVLAAGIGAGVAALAHNAVPAEQTEMAEVLKFVALCGVGLTILHAAWWVLVARWRSRGLLTPNVVVVGATSHAADRIAHAIDRRDMNILGVFDDRAERSPLAMEGVPVLGTTDSMLRHRIMPYVDLVVVTIDQSAAARVREITDRLAVLPNAVTLLFDDATVASAARRELARAGTEVTFGAGESIVRQGDDSDAMFVVVSGTCEVLLPGNQRVELHPGAHFGELALLTGDPRTADVRAGGNGAHVLRLPRASVTPVLLQQPRFRDRFSAIAKERLDALAPHAAEQVAHSRHPTPLRFLFQLLRPF